MSKMRSPILRSCLLVIVIASSLFLAWPSSAESVETGATLVLVPANEEASIEFRALCMEFTEAFPASFGSIGDRAPDEVLKLVAAALSDGTIESEILQTQAALWRTIERSWPYPEGDLERDVQNALLEIAEETAVPELFEDDRVISIQDAIAEDKIEASSNNFLHLDAPSVYAGEGAYAGEGTMILTNLTDENLYVYYPMGTVLNAGLEDEQNMVTYVTDPSPTDLPDTGVALFERIYASVQPPASLWSEEAATAGEISVALPSVGVSSSVVPVGWTNVLQEDGKLKPEWEVASFAVGWHKNSALPGLGGNVVLSGHNNADGAVFRNLDQMSPGDLIFLYSGSEIYHYQVEEVLVLPYSLASAANKSELERWIRPSTEDRLTLVSCYPHYGDTHRVIVLAYPDYSEELPNRDE